MVAGSRLKNQVIRVDGVDDGDYFLLEGIKSVKRAVRIRSRSGLNLKEFKFRNPDKMVFGVVEIRGCCYLVRRNAQAKNTSPWTLCN